jgi:cytochrome c
LNNYGILSVAGALAVLVTACGQGSDGSPADPGKPAFLTAATLGEQQVMSIADYMAAPEYAGANQVNGERQARYCLACHSLESGGTVMVGPPLHGFFGTRAGTQEGFDYSSALRDAQFVWTPRALDAWLAQPGRFLPGNRMVFAGVPKDSDRRDLIAYLLVTTGNARGHDQGED